ncbi:uncharacterized protein BJ171DRAFT_132528 [Polychytrium aggregatum]|uniref:uncharacterized protein n=1 Tax=Polychytrium aggregatum TaxID=110093 RepID=UPI0022FDFB91|nr:uncharacterized protein BJ171DRAFT_132528 [Polychytrium aggregatum]KAI9203753.1 hypothetical protein BJ171DRAFT_132528 [Polychytrium aggregatum]
MSTPSRPSYEALPGEGAPPSTSTMQRQPPSSSGIPKRTLSVIPQSRSSSLDCLAKEGVLSIAIVPPLSSNAGSKKTASPTSSKPIGIPIASLSLSDLQITTFSTEATTPTNSLPLRPKDSSSTMATTPTASTRIKEAASTTLHNKFTPALTSAPTLNLPPLTLPTPHPTTYLSATTPAVVTPGSVKTSHAAFGTTPTAPMPTRPTTPLHTLARSKTPALVSSPEHAAAVAQATLSRPVAAPPSPVSSRPTTPTAPPPAAPAPEITPDLPELMVYMTYRRLHPNAVIANEQSLPQHYMMTQESIRSVLKITQVSFPISVLSLLYLFRLKEPSQTATEYEILTNCLILSQKFLDDNRYTNRTWAKVISRSLEEINSAEMVILKDLNWDINVSKSEYTSFLRTIQTFKKELSEKLPELRPAFKSYRMSMSSTRPRNPASQPPPPPLPSPTSSTPVSATTPQGTNFPAPPNNAVVLPSSMSALSHQHNTQHALERFSHATSAPSLKRSTSVDRATRNPISVPSLKRSLSRGHAIIPNFLKSNSTSDAVGAPNSGNSFWTLTRKKKESKEELHAAAAAQPPMPHPSILQQQQQQQQQQQRAMTRNAAPGVIVIGADN